jgi:hypothetical protein
MLFTANGNEQSIQVAVLGDGTSTVLKIDPTKPPLDLSFSKTPIQARILAQDGPTPQVTMSGNVVTLTYAKPFPAPPNIGSMSPRSQFLLYFLYAGEP